MTWTQLGLYNAALIDVGERRIASLAENREPRRLLDGIWADGGGAVRTCLEAGLWKFAKRTIQLTYSPSIEPDFGYRYAFQIPEDFVRTITLCSDEFFNCPLLQYSEEAGFWFSDIDTIYIGYVSNDLAYGNDLSLWPESFGQMVAAYLAMKLAPRLKNGTDQDKINKAYKDQLLVARSRDAMEDPTRFPPEGNWVRSRRGRSSRGSRSERYS